MSVDPNMIIARARMSKGVQAFGSLGTWGPGVAFVPTGLGAAASQGQQSDSLFVDSGYDDGAGNVVYSTKAQETQGPRGAWNEVKRNPVPAAIALGVGIVAVTLLISVLKG